MTQTQRYLGTLSIRQAAGDDLTRITELDHEAFAWSNTAEDEIIFEHRLQSYPQGCLVAQLDRCVVGYCTSEKWANELEPAIGQDPRKTHDPGGKVLCITGFAITKAHQRLGIGTVLLTELLRVAKAEECYCVLLETGNAKAFYGRFGFRKIGMRSQNGATMSIVRLDI